MRKGFKRASTPRVYAKVLQGTGKKKPLPAWQEAQSFGILQSIRIDQALYDDPKLLHELPGQDSELCFIDNQSFEVFRLAANTFDDRAPKVGSHQNRARHLGLCKIAVTKYRSGQIR